ncbi:hypothetical protein ACFVUP_38035, partial [Streptomyces bacillaris]|uniref:hypothetical protein n=1 Tax=Streptomyces bacillaris TaxID=68179 RepID=UPI0036DF87D1
MAGVWCGHCGEQVAAESAPSITSLIDPVVTSAPLPTAPPPVLPRVDVEPPAVREVPLLVRSAPVASPVRRDRTVEEMVFDPMPAGGIEVYPTRFRRPRGRWVVVIVAATAVAVVATIGSVVWFSAAPSGAAKPTSTPALVAPLVTLPGWAGTAQWHKTSVVDAAISPDGSLVVALSGSTAAVLNASTGRQVGSVRLVGDKLGVLAGFAGTAPAVVAFSNTAATLWTADNAGVPIDLSGGREITVRSGKLMVTNPDGSASLLTPAGQVPAVSPRAGTIPIGMADHAVLWASARGTVISASVTGTILTEAPLTAPAAGAKVSGWLVAANAHTVTVIWSTPAGASVLGVHNTVT